MKNIEYSSNNDIPVEILHFPCVLLNRSVLYDCEIEAEDYFLLESLATHP